MVLCWLLTLISFWGSFACADHVSQALSLSESVIAVQESCPEFLNDIDKIEHSIPSHSQDQDNKECSDCCLGCCHHILITAISAPVISEINEVKKSNFSFSYLNIDLEGPFDPPKINALPS